jgi:hypothetical protein
MKEWRSYPTILGRLPLFLPLKSNLRSTSFECPWGSVISEKALNTFDEDVFISLYNFAKNMDGHMIYEGNLYQLCKSMNKAHGTVTFKEIETCISDMTTTQVKIDTKYKKQRYDFHGSLIIRNEIWGRNVMIAMNPDIFRLNKKSYIDINVRNQLSPTGKALYRFISSHKYEGLYLDRIHEAVAPHQRLDNFMIEIAKELDKLKELQYIKSWRIEKVGRKSKLGIIKCSNNGKGRGN